MNNTCFFETSFIRFNISNFSKMHDVLRKDPLMSFVLNRNQSEAKLSILI